MPIDSPFPASRPRRLRRGSLIRDAVANVHLSASDLIYPLFVTSGEKICPVESMPGVNQLPVQDAMDTIERLSAKGLRQFILFGVTPQRQKDPAGQYARDEQAPVNQTLRAVKSKGLEVLMYADLCFCEYTDHGHCGVLHSPDEPAKASQWVVDNDRTLEILGKTAVVQAGFGADVVAPSGMIDGQVGAVRGALDEAGHEHVAILSYSVKFASDFYGPFRDAGAGAMQFGDRRGYQMDYRRVDEWRTELQGDLAQGADMVMVKPASTYLDIIHQVRSACSVPVVGYHVSGEYAMLHAAGDKGWLDLRAAALETTYAIKRAGADLIITYFAPQLLDWLSD